MPHTPLRILLAEDNPVNQKVAVGMLEKRGHLVSVVADGRQALAALERESFDLVLMDVQMPEMGGREASLAWREIERTRGGHVPIVAVTANAMKGDREACLAAGMDGYISKPVKFDTLIEAVERHAHGVPDSKADVALAARIRALLDLFAGDGQLLRDVAEVYLQSEPAHRQRIRDALAARQVAELGAAAHSFKGSVGNFGARAAFDAAFQLERMARTGDLTGAGPVVAELERAADVLRRELEHVLADPRQDTAG